MPLQRGWPLNWPARFTARYIDTVYRFPRGSGRPILRYSGIPARNWPTRAPLAVRIQRATSGSHERRRKNEPLGRAGHVFGGGTGPRAAKTITWSRNAGPAAGLDGNPPRAHGRRSIGINWPRSWVSRFPSRPGGSARWLSRPRLHRLCRRPKRSSLPWRWRRRRLSPPPNKSPIRPSSLPRSVSPRRVRKDGARADGGSGAAGIGAKAKDAAGFRFRDAR